MKFGPIPLDEALGAILAHSLALPGGLLKKGRALSAADLARLRSAGHTEVVAARLADDDVGEDEAARRLAAALTGSGVTAAAPFTGRANLFAFAAGLLRFDPAALTALNALDERITVASLAANERVEAGQMIATVKLIPFAVPTDVLAAAERRAAAARLAVAVFKPARVGLILTTLPSTKASVLAKREQVIADRLQLAGSRIARTDRVAHDAAAIRQAIATNAADVDLVLVFAASAIVDRGDVVPAGLVAAGGVIDRLGMPVDPGNLLLLGRLGATPVVGIPSCAASPKLNGFDWVLQRLLAGLPPTPDDFAAMAVGGLLKEIASRPQPRDGGAAGADDRGRHAPRIATLVLAAGRSTRMGSNKLLALLDGKPILRHVVEAAVASRSAIVRVVTGHASDEARAALAGLAVEFVDNPDYALGISTSVKAGLAGLAADIDGVLIALGDMPDLGAGHIDRMIAAFDPKENRSIVVPTFEGKRGNPVLWGRQYFADMQGLGGDTGARHLLGVHGEQVVELDLASDAVLTDVDTPQALATLRARRRNP